MGLIASVLLLAGCQAGGEGGSWEGLNWGQAKVASGVASEVAAHAPNTGIVAGTPGGDLVLTIDPDQLGVRTTARFTLVRSRERNADQRLAAAALDLRRNADYDLVVEPMLPMPVQPTDRADLEIVAPDADSATLRSGAGRITATNLAGPVHASTTDGGILVRNHNGPVHARCEAGDIDIELSPEAVEPLDAQTGAGNIRVVLGKAFGGMIRVQAGNGTATIDDPAGRVVSRQLEVGVGELHIGEGGPTSTLITADGDITLVVLP
jgi:hypothetical protein